MKRRDFLKQTGTTAIAASLANISSPFFNFGADNNKKKKMLILGIDGMDPQITRRLMLAGKLPHLAKLANNGTFTNLGTTIPPQSPVAWGSFATGTDPGAFGIFEFLHRNPKTYYPQFSMSDTIPASNFLPLGKYRIPLSSAKYVNKLKGKPFWDYLEQHDVAATVFKIPVNFPTDESSQQRMMSGMGTPSLRGGYGMYTIYTTDEAEVEKDIKPNYLYYALINENNVMEDGVIEGPENELLEGKPKSRIPFKVYLDYTNKTARIDIQDKEILIAEKEYSGWVELDFPLIGNIKTIKGMVRFYLMELGYNFRLYISPIHIDPLEPAAPICSPPGYSQELVENNGLFHTLDMPADFTALKQESFSMENFIVQSESVLDESIKIFHYELDHLLSGDSGCLFFYFSSMDQGQHMYWALADPKHPYYHPEVSQRFGGKRDELYLYFDRLVGQAMKQLPPDLPVFLMSDHGFGTFRRQVNINRWLVDEGYIHLKGNPDPGEITSQINILKRTEWEKTRAYTIGLNSIYINQAGREGKGIVSVEQKRKLMEEIKAKLENSRDPQTGEKYISNVYITEDHFTPDHPGIAPDLVVGFKRGYRSSEDSALGKLSRNVIEDNKCWWSGDHCIDPQEVPGICLSNVKISQTHPHIKDFAPTIVKYFTGQVPSHMTGKSLLS